MSARGRPLSCLRIAVTRARGKAASLSRRLRASGARVLELSAIRTAPIARPRGLERVMRGLESYGWIVFTSATGVECFFSLLRRRKRGFATLSGARLAAIGPGTGEELRRHGREADLIPRTYVAESLSRAMGKVRGLRVLIPRALKAREVLPRSLAGRGAQVTVLPVYRTLPDRRGLAKIRSAVLGRKLDAILFTSPSTAEMTVRRLGPAGRRALRDRIRVFSIGPVTGAALARLRVPVAAAAKVHTVEGLARAVVRYYMKTRGGRRLRGGRRERIQ